jgi:hypothetical protein
LFFYGYYLEVASYSCDVWVFVDCFQDFFQFFFFCARVTVEGNMAVQIAWFVAGVSVLADG